MAPLGEFVTNPAALETPFLTMLEALQTAKAEGQYARPVSWRTFGRALVWKDEMLTVHGTGEKKLSRGWRLTVPFATRLSTTNVEVMPTLEEMEEGWEVLTEEELLKEKGFLRYFEGKLFRGLA